MTLSVVAIALVDDLDAPTALLAARRSRGALAGGWELPGGKVEPGEQPDEALARELQEELALVARLGPAVAGPLAGGWPIGDGGTLRVRLGAVAGGTEPVPGPDHDEVRWLALDDDPAAAVAWLEADVPVVEALRSRLRHRRLLVLPERDAADVVAAALRALGVEAGVHRELLAGDDDLEDAQWVVALDPGPAALAVPDDDLERLAESHDGWLERD